ncbi:MAG: hypothetical protein AAF916_08990 [Planctomycetota bacterium]
MQYDLTNAQYDALIKLTATLNKVLPKIKLDAHRDNRGNVRRDALNPEEQAAFQGVIAHHQLTVEKVDPGPAFDWERLLEGTKKLR